MGRARARRRMIAALLHPANQPAHLLDIHDASDVLARLIRSEADGLSDVVHMHRGYRHRVGDRV